MARQSRRVLVGGRWWVAGQRATSAVATASRPSPRPGKPRPSVVVAEMLTGAPAAALIAAAASPRRGPNRGRGPITWTATLPISYPASRTSRAVSVSSCAPEAPAQRGSAVPNREPRSPRSAAESSASHAACAATSPSEWPSRPTSPGHSRQATKSGRPLSDGAKAWTSVPIPVRGSMRAGYRGSGRGGLAQRAVRAHLDPYREQQQEADGEHGEDPDDAPVLRFGRGLPSDQDTQRDGQREGGGRHEAHRPPGGGVQPEQLTLLALGDEPGEERAGRGLGRTHEHAQHQPECPEDGGAVLVEEEHAQPGEDHRDEGADDHPLGPEEVIEGAEGDGGHAGDEVGGHPEDDHLSGREAEDGGRDDPAEGEHPREPVPEDGAGEQEVHRVVVLAPHVRDRAEQQLVGADQPQPRRPVRTGGGGVPHGEQHGQGEQQRPHGTNEHGHPHVHAVLRGDPEDADLGVDEPEVHDEQQHDAADVAQPPAQPRDPTDGPGRGEVAQHRVVVHRCELEEDVAGCEQHQAQPQVAGVGLDEEQGGREHHDGHRVEAQPERPAPGPVRAQAGDRCTQRDERTRGGQGPAQLLRGTRTEGVGGDVHGEHEGGDHRVERGRPPVPQAPRVDRPPEAATALGGLGGWLLIVGGHGGTVALLGVWQVTNPRAGSLGCVSLRLHDSATRTERELVPLRPGHVGIYLCGATVQGSPHVSHLRSGIAFDVLARWPRRRGLEVTLIRNVTDIDDKILTKSSEAGVPWWAWAHRFEQEFTAAYDALGVERPTYEPRATGHITEMVSLIDRLLERGHAYRGEGANVYFDVRSYPERSEERR